MSRLLAGGAAALFMSLAAPAAWAQLINVDVSGDAGSPGPGFAGAALMDGVWNTIVGQVQQPLVDRLGSATGAHVQVFSSGPDAHFDHPNTPGSLGALLDDWRVAHFFASFNEVDAIVSGLPPGFYEVTTYAWVPDDPDARMHVFVQHSVPPVTTGGAWPGAFLEGITHTRHLVEVTAAGQKSDLFIRIVTANDHDGALNGFQIMRVATDPALATFCAPQTPNSTGVPAALTVLGSRIPAHALLVADGRDLPPNVFGYLLASQLSTFAVTPPGSQGSLCLGGNIARFRQQIRNTGAGGLFRIALDLTAFPVNPPQPVQPGDTWHFQLWYRDANPAPTSNFSTGYTFGF